MLPNNKGNFNWEHLLIMTLKESSTPEKIKQGGTGKPLVQYTISVCIQKHIMVAGFSPVSGLYSFSPIIAYDFEDKYRC